MMPRILRASETEEFDTAERCAIQEISNLGDDPAVSVARARVAPGETTAWHRLTGVTERYLVFSGTGSIEIGTEAPTPLHVGDVALIPAGVAQRITNIGRDDLIFYAICSPRFTPECYVTLE